MGFCVYVDHDVLVPHFQVKVHLRNFEVKIDEELQVLQSPVSAATVKREVDKWHVSGKPSARTKNLIIAEDIDAAQRLLSENRTEEASVLVARMAEVRVKQWLNQFHPLKLGETYRPYGKPDFSQKLPHDRVFIRVNGRRAERRRVLITKNPCKTSPSIQIYWTLSEEEAVQIFGDQVPNAENVLILPAKVVPTVDGVPRRWPARWVVDRHAGADCDGDDFLAIFVDELIDIIAPMIEEQGDASLLWLRKRFGNMSPSSSVVSSSAVGAPSDVSASLVGASDHELDDDELDQRLRMEIRDDLHHQQLLGEVDRKWLFISDKYGGTAAQMYGYFCELAVDKKLSRSFVLQASAALPDGDENHRRALRDVESVQWAPMPRWYAAYKGKKGPMVWRNAIVGNSVVAELYSHVQDLRKGELELLQSKAMELFRNEQWARGARTVSELWEKVKRRASS